MWMRRARAVSDRAAPPDLSEEARKREELKVSQSDLSEMFILDMFIYEKKSAAH